MEKSVEIAKTYGASVKMVTVVDHESLNRHRRNDKLWKLMDGSIAAGKPAAAGDDNFSDTMRENAEELLNSMIEDLDLCDMSVEKEVLFGEPYIEILNAAEREKADLIVMGNRGFSRIKRFFVGSVTQRVISAAECPVLVIHTDSKD
jgi:nucleotide-binding universal stress UspA family protein